MDAVSLLGLFLAFVIPVCGFVWIYLAAQEFKN